eukprot:2042999-Amphidinium_carterae.1
MSFAPAAMVFMRSCVLYVFASRDATVSLRDEVIWLTSSFSFQSTLTHAWRQDKSARDAIP